MEYSLAFAKQLIEAASALKGPDLIYEERRRAVLYLSLLSIEITLKYLLEKSGVRVQEIRGRSHSIEKLLSDLDDCEFFSTISGDPSIDPLSGTITSKSTSSRTLLKDSRQLRSDSLVLKLRITTESLGFFIILLLALYILDHEA